ncbi:hypothetical protein ACJJTC_010858 [Scirpophaga incertulas]
MSKRKRDPTFAASEKQTLIELVERHFDIVENKKTDSVSIKLKNEEWQKISTEFNAISSIHPRDWGVLKNCWENLKKRAKQCQTSRNQHFLGTGGGPPKKIIEDPAIDRVLELIQTRITGFTNSYDSDGTLVLASGSSNVETQGTTDQRVSTDTVNSEQDWSQYTPSMLRLARHPALARPQSPLPTLEVAPNSPLADPLVADQTPVPVANPQITTAEQPSTSTARQIQITPLRSGTTPAATESAATTSRRRPVLRREREVRSLNSERIKTLLQCNTHAEEEHSLQMKILQLQQEREKEILKQEILKTKQELKLEILKIQLENL